MHTSPASLRAAITLEINRNSLLFSPGNVVSCQRPSGATQIVCPGVSPTPRSAKQPSRGAVLQGELTPARVERTPVPVGLSRFVLGNERSACDYAQ
ncbi:hypothetical protein SCUP234_03198 [Seiridium cupressi]